MCLFCIRGELKLIKENLIKINKEYDIYTKKGALKKFIDSKKNQFYQIITIKDNKNKIRDAIEESQKGIYLVNDVISCNDELSDDDDL